MAPGQASDHLAVGNGGRAIIAEGDPGEHLPSDLDGEQVLAERVVVDRARKRERRAISLSRVMGWCPWPRRTRRL